jgi:ABC-type antimicrobial peptide transport system permease subunit
MKAKHATSGVGVAAAAVVGSRYLGDLRRATVAASGWLLGLALGYGLARLFNWLVLKIVGIEFAFLFPPMNALLALVGTILLALLVMRIPLRRAVRLKPGDAIRYA